MVDHRLLRNAPLSYSRLALLQPEYLMPGVHTCIIDALTYTGISHVFKVARRVRLRSPPELQPSRLLRCFCRTTKACVVTPPALVFGGRGVREIPRARSSVRPTYCMYTVYLFMSGVKQLKS